MKTIFVCYGSYIENSFSDYWTDMLVGDTLEELYEAIAAFKIAYERPQKPNEAWRVAAKYPNYISHTDVEFSNILQVIVPEDYDYYNIGITVSDEKIIGSKQWQAKLAKEQAIIDAEKAANKEAAEARADKRRAVLNRKRNK